ncbi:hypothetical protein PoB_003334100 [Plakobranchus ocellatus]|uniref:Sushi domain-containing protein n=1 Tax=Plakobranchus ocellatus TaxID=259542 RepID=A0AAV4A6J9_9GAST|nr:hypothetical protein PoB_003334100 [Plakobranchus ocellatus]
MNRTKSLPEIESSIRVCPPLFNANDRKTSGVNVMIKPAPQIVSFLETEDGATVRGLESIAVKQFEPEVAVCDPLPTSYRYNLSTVKRSIGQIVKVICTGSDINGSSSSDRTEAILKCQPDLRWNSTVPSCKPDDSSDSPGTVLILVWTIGGVLLFILTILIILIIKSKSKPRESSHSEDSSQASVFHVTGVTPHRTPIRDWADNPAFTRADERCSELSPGHEQNRLDASRLPSYQEAILHNYLIGGRTSRHSRTTVTVADVHEGTPSFVRANAPPSYRSSQLQHSRYHPGNSRVSQSETTNQTPCSPQSPLPANRETALNNHINQSESPIQEQAAQMLENTLPAEEVTVQVGADGASSQSGNRTCSHSQSEIRTSMPRPSTTSSTSLQSSSLSPSTSTSTTTPATSAHVLSSRRYVEQYPSCFFEEDPPPPYTPGPPAYRSRARRSFTAGTTTSPAPYLTTNTNSNNCRGSQQQHQQSHFQRGELYRRTLHALPSERASQYRNLLPARRENDHSHVQIFPYTRPGVHDRSSTQRDISSSSEGTQPMGVSTYHSQYPCYGPTSSATAAAAVSAPPSTLSSSSSSSLPCSAPTGTTNSTYLRDSGYTSNLMPNHSPNSPQCSALPGPPGQSSLHIPRPCLTQEHALGAVNLSGNNTITHDRYPKLVKSSHITSASHQPSRPAIPSSSSLTCSALDTRHVARSEHGIIPAITTNEAGITSTNHVTSLYVMRSSQATPSAPPLDTLPSLTYLEAPPLGTSTPINQSPAVPRRSAPPINLSGQTQQRISSDNQQSSQNPCAPSELRNVYSENGTAGPSCISNGSHFETWMSDVPGLPLVPQYRHDRQTSAPLAR